MLLIVGLSNRHTRGATKTVATILGILVAVAIGLRFLAAPEPEATVWYDSQVQPDFLAQSGSTESIQHLDDWQPTVPAATTGSASSHTRLPMSVGLISPVVAVVFLGIVYMLFKYCGPAVGLTGLAVPLLFIGFGYISYHDTHQSQSTYRVEAHAESEASGQLHGPGRMELGTSASASLGEAVVATNRGPGAPMEIPLAEADSTPPGPDAPQWVRNPPKSTENLYRRVVETEWWPDEATCRQKSDEVLQREIAQWMSSIHREAVGNYRGVSPESIGLTPGYIRDRLVTAEYFASREFTHDDGVNLYMQIEIPESQKQWVIRQWRNEVRGHQTAAVAMGMGSVLACLAGVLGLIKLDTYTKGYYTKRLFIGVPLAIISGTLLLGLFAKLL